MKRSLAILAVLFGVAVPSASAQSLGTFRWQLQPYGSVLQISVTQQGGIYLLDGIELQCGGNASLPVNGVAVPQANGSVILGLTTINEQGRGLHTRATINTSRLQRLLERQRRQQQPDVSVQSRRHLPGRASHRPDQRRTRALTASPALQAQVAALTARLAALAAAKQ